MYKLNLGRLIVATFVASVVCFAVVVGAQADYIVADSRVDFSGEQGQDNWYYGSYTIEDPVAYEASDFVPLDDEYWDGSYWSRTGDGWWIQFRSSNAHPDTSRWNIRRWVSEVSSPIRIDWHVAMGSSNAYDGVTARIFHNGGDAIDSAVVAGTDTTGYTKSVAVTVESGDYIDFALDDNTNSNADTTYFYATITAVPEPSTFVLLAVGGLALLLVWRWRK